MRKRKNRLIPTVRRTVGHVWPIFLVWPKEERVPDWEHLPKLLTIRETASILDVHPNTLRLWDEQGALRAIRLGSRRDRRYAKEVVLSRWREKVAAPLNTPGRARLWTQVKMAIAMRAKHPAFVWVVAFLCLVTIGSLHQGLTLAQTKNGAGTTTLLSPSRCSGWRSPQAARQIDVRRPFDSSSYTPDLAAIFDARQLRVQGGTDGQTVVGPLSPLDPTIQCSGFQNHSAALMTRGVVRIVLANTFQLNSTDLLTLAGSIDGKTWIELQHYPSANDIPGSYDITLPPPLLNVTPDHLRLRLVADVNDLSTSIFRLDGLALLATVALPSVPPTNPGAKQQLDRLTSISQQLYHAGDHPVLMLPKHRDNKFLFMTTGHEDWRLSEVSMKDTSGVAVPVQFRTQDRRQGSAVMTEVTVDPTGLHPGKYTITAQVETPENTTESVTKTFLWGVVALNFRRATVHTGDEQQVGIGVLDDTGKTLCGADITVKVTSPNGQTRTYTTKDKSIATNPDCVDKSVTNAADYSFTFPANAAGLYQIHLEANTTAGRRTVDDNFQADDSIIFDVHRVDYPTRIFPPASYPVGVAITPRQDFHGLVRETVPASFIIANITSSGTLHPDAEKKTQTIEWPVDWQKDQTYYYGYTFDAPNISPALFTTGPLTIVGGDGAVSYAEPRSWQIASDAILLSDGQEAIGRLVDAGRGPTPTSLRVEKSVYQSSENPTFVLPAKNDGKRGKVSKVELVNADGVAIPVRIYDQADATTPRALTVSGENGFQPGRYSMQVTYDEKGGPPLTDTQQFVWGVLVVNPEKSIYLPGETAKLGMAALDATGKTLCQADLTLTVTSPKGSVTTLSTANGTISRNYTCDIHSVTNAPDYSADYITTETGTYRLKLTSVMKAGQDRTSANDTFSIDDSFEVQADAPFDVSRAGTATRLYPIEDYTANTTIVPRQDYAGPITETLPSSFRAYNISDQGSISLGKDGLTQTITWTVDWKQGQTYTLSYRFDPPNQSPRIYTLGPLVIGDFHETRSWQLAADATKTWDGGGGADTNWSTAANWDLDTVPATDDSIVLDATSNNAMIWDNIATVSQISALTVSSHSGDVTISKSGAKITGAYSNTGTGNVTHTVNVTVGGNYTLTNSGTFTPNSTTLSMVGAGTTINTSKTHYALTIDVTDPATGTVTMSTNSFTYSNLLTIAANDTLSIDNSLILTSSATSGTSLTLNGTMSGAGTYYYLSSATFPSGGTFSTNIRFNVSAGNSTIPGGRTITGNVEVWSNAAANKFLYVGTTTGDIITINGNVVVTNANGGAYRTYLEGRTGVGTAPTLVVSGNLTCNSGGVPTVTIGTNAEWKVGGNFNTASCSTFSASAGSTLNMTTAGGNVNLNTGTVPNLLISAAGTVTVGGTTTASSSLTINNGATLDTGTAGLYVASGATFSIGSTGTLTSSSSGYMMYQTTSAFPTTGTVSANIRFDASTAPSGNLSIPARTFSNSGVTTTIIAYNNSGAGKTIEMGAGNLVIAGDLVIWPRSAGALVLNATGNPDITLGGNFSVTAGSGTADLTMGSGTWTASGTFNLTTITNFSSTGTLSLNGSGKVFTSNGKTLNNLTLSGTSLASATHTVAGDLTLAGSIMPNTSTISMTGTKNIAGGGFTLYNLTLTGTPTVTVTGSVNISNVLTVPALATLSINSGQVVWLTKTTTGTITFPDTAIISGAGILRYTSSTAFVTTGTLNATLSYDATSANQTMANRTYGGGIEAYSNSGSARLVYPSANTSMTTLGVNANAGGSVTFDATVGSTQNYTITASSDVSCTKASTGVPTIITGTGAWAVGGSLNLTNCAITATTGNTLTMSGTGDLIGAGLTLYNLAINGNGNTVTAKTSDLTVANTLTIGGAADGNNDTLTISSGITITLSLTSGTALTINNSGTDTINGPGRLTYRTSTDFPTVGTLGAVLITRFDMVTNSMNLPVRADYGTIEAYNSGSSIRTLTFSSASAYTLSGNFDVQATSSGTTIVTAVTNGPAVNITGNLTYSSCSATCTIQSGAGTWTVTGSVTMTNGTYTAATNNTLVMNGTGTLTPAGNTLYNLTSSGASVAASGATALNGDMLISGGSFTAPAAAFTVNGNWTNSGGTFVEGTGTVTLAGLTSTTLNSACSNTDTCTNENFYDLVINKTDASDANDNVTLTTNGIRVTNTLTITDGELIQGALNVRAEGSTAVSIGAAGKWSNISTGDIKIGGNFVNAGILYLDVQGNSNGCLAGDTDDISFTSVDTTARALSGAGTYTLYDVTADYLNATVSITINGGTDGGHNTGSWTFTSCGVAISGTVYLTNETTTATSGNGGPCDGSTAVLSIRINGGTAATGSCSNTTAAYSITTAAPPSTGDTIAVYLTSTAKGNLIFLSDGSADTGMNVIISQVSLAHKNAGPIGITNLTSYDNTADATNMLFDAVSGTPNTLTVNTNIELDVVASSTFTPVGTVTTQGTGDFHVLGTSTLDTATSAIGRNIVVPSGGTLNINATTTVAGGGITTAGTATVTTTAGTPTVTVSGTGSIGGGSNALTFYNLTLSGTPTLASGLSINHNVVFPVGVVGGSQTVTMNNGGTTITGGGGTITNLTLANGSGVVTLTTSDLTVSGTLTTNSGSNITIDTGRTLTLSSAATFASNGTCASNTTGLLWYQNTTTFPTTGTVSCNVRLDTHNGNISVPARTGATNFGGNLEIYGDTAIARTITLGTAGSQTISVAGNFTITAANGQTLAMTVTGATNVPLMNITGNVSVAKAGTGVNSNLSMGNTWTVTGNIDLSNINTLTTGNEVVMNGTSATLNGNAKSLYKLTIDGSIIAQTGNVTVSNVLAVNAAHTLTITGVTVTSGTAGSVAVNATGSITGTGTLLMNSANLTLNGTTIGANVEYDTNNTNGTIAVPNGSYGANLRLKGLRTSGVGTFTMISPTVTGNFSWGDSSGITTTTLTVSGSPTITGNVTYANAGIPNFGDTFNMGSGTWTVGGNFDLTDTPTYTNTGTLAMNGTGTLTSAGLTLANVTLSGTNVTLGDDLAMNGNLVLGGTTVTPGATTVTMSGTGKTIDGGGKTLNNLTISGTETLQNTDLTVSGTLQVDASKQVSINSGVNLNQSGTLTLNGTITGAGTLIIKDTSTGPGAAVGSTLSSVVRFDATTGNIASTTLDARTYGGAVEFYSNAAGSPTRTMTFPIGTFTFSGAVSTNRANTGTITVDADTSDPAITVAGAMTIGANTTWSASSASAFNINGNYTNSGTFTHNSGTVTLAGTSAQQDLSGTLSGSTGKFNNLVITNAFGDGNLTWSVTFGGNAETAATFTAATASTKLRFNAGSTYTFAAINFNGQAVGTLVTLRSSSAGAPWYIVAGAGARTVSFLDVKDSDACGSTGGAIDGSDGTVADGGGNSCWTIRKLTVSLSGSSAALGTLATNAISYIGITSTVTSSGGGGYVSLVKYDNTLTSGSNTITDAGGSITAGQSKFGASSSQSGNTIAQTDTSPACSTSLQTQAGTATASSLSSTFQSFASAATTVTNQAATLCLLGSISGTTPAGAYSSTLTVTTTARF